MLGINKKKEKLLNGLRKKEILGLSVLVSNRKNNLD
jgi:hypothetical protein